MIMHDDVKDFEIVLTIIPASFPIISHNRRKDITAFVLT